jgi:DNA topoisomerase IB
MRIDTGFALLAGVLALTLGAVAPASAEFFGCHDKPGQLLYSYSGTPRSYHSHHSYSRDSAYRSSGTTDDYAAHTRYYRAGSSRATNYRSQR